VIRGNAFYGCLSLESFVLGLRGAGDGEKPTSCFVDNYGGLYVKRSSDAAPLRLLENEGSSNSISSNWPSSDSKASDSKSSDWPSSNSKSIDSKASDSSHSESSEWHSSEWNPSESKPEEWIFQAYPPAKDPANEGKQYQVTNPGAGRSVVGIAAGALAYAKYVQKVTIARTVTYAEDGSFSYMSALTSVTWATGQATGKVDGEVGQYLDISADFV
jgi:hypothetical protein